MATMQQDLTNDDLIDFMEFCINRFYGEQIHMDLLMSALQDYIAQTTSPEDLEFYYAN